ncbi:uncharacterized protein LOC129590543 isoform X1 [Paramacrobiotus metropolitanus]|uniref:uncharacterized protein LOC129590543 isoform X1 n=1 Tax=Paramacrobiotus metropolitanus TaxID=2943436 RepID=UPI002445AFD5|nr:uncharacterized protein LOC129590543 isoform X1 [Paramacrobiotus metropolitanus]XP_055341801.1 uncharacterized protein LOC129590543 isoform X1 [Paramacrobiotus metropolitanus]
MDQPCPSAPPPPYAEDPPVYGNAAPLVGEGLQAVDFLPRMLAGDWDDGPSGRSTPRFYPEYEPFSVLVERANTFLHQHPRCCVNTCESVELRVHKRGRSVDKEWSLFTVYGESSNRYIRGLRLWTQRVVSANQTEPDQIGYVDFLPQIAADQVERLDGVLHRVNSDPIKGQLITMETLPIKWGSNGLDPERTIWTEGTWTSERFVQVIRMFYLRGRVQHAQVGVMDFVPVRLDSAGGSARPRMETFPAVMQRTKEWLLSVPPNYRLINIQTVSFRWNDKKALDTKDMTYSLSKKQLVYLRFLRVAYLTEDPADGPISRSMIQLGCKLIVPQRVPRTGFFDEIVLESQEACRQRVDAWVKAAGARVVAAETLVMRVAGGGEAVYGMDAMHTWNDTHQVHVRTSSRTVREDEQFMYVYRIYTDGMVAEVREIRTEPDDTREMENGAGCPIV